MADAAHQSGGATERLLAWFDANARDLPWRGRRDAYEIWVSEVMLQQTRSETVERYYERFLHRFPNVRSLARASEEEVLAAWSGLGYYRRARNLHAGARRVVAAGGAVPATVEDLRRLPGVGAYTAAAIASIAFDVAAPVVDGNVERVLTRYEAIDISPRRAAGRRAVLELARRLISARRPGDSNQALMELGALVCTPRGPKCGECPLAFDCLARERDAQERYPVAAPRRGSVRERWVAAVVRQGGCLLLSRRSASAALLAGMWELPAVEDSGEPPEEALGRLYGGRWRLGETAGVVRHSITHRSLEVAVHDGRWETEVREAGAIGEGGRLAWLPEADLPRLPTGSLVRKALAVLASPD